MNWFKGLLLGGILGGIAGTWSARRLSERRGALNIVFSVVITAVALYMLTHSLLQIWG